MNQELKERWLTALRSGEYAQGKTVLFQNDRYCCLGVLCKINARLNEAGYALSDDDEPCTNIELPPSFRTRIGISSKQEGELISMNDDQGKTFAEIATYIEANL